MSDNIADTSDLASLHEELFLGIAMQHRRPSGPAPTGKCLWCDEPVDDDRRWCGPECRDMYELKNRK